MHDEKKITNRDSGCQVHSVTADCCLISHAANTRTACAYHEAAHAVVGEALDFRVRYASIVADAELLGHCELHDSVARNGHIPILGVPRAVAFLTYSLAGHAVETIRDTMPIECVPVSDLDGIQPVLLALARDLHRDPEEIFWRLLGSTIEFVAQEQVWSAIEQVARVLLDRDVVQGDHVRRIVRDCGLTVYSEAQQVSLAMAMAARKP